MTALNKQTLREAAEKALNARERLELIESIFDDDGDITTEAQEDIKICTSFNDLTNPNTVLALLDELEAAEKRIAELDGLALENIRLKVGISGLIGLGLRYADADVMRLAADAQQSTPTTDGIIENIVAGIGVKGE